MILKDNNRLVLPARDMSRRGFLALGLATVASGMLAQSPLAAVEDLGAPDRSLYFYNVYTKEELNAVYWRNGEYIPKALVDINYMLRDIRTGRIKPIDVRLLDLLSAISRKLKCSEPFSMISGYRSPRSNAILRKQKKGVARNSLHMYGKAIDISLPGYSLRGVRSAAMDLRMGGVGYYPRSKFIHVDVGNIRYWRG